MVSFLSINTQLKYLNYIQICNPYNWQRAMYERSVIMEYFENLMISIFPFNITVSGVLTALLSILLCKSSLDAWNPDTGYPHNPDYYPEHTWTCKWGVKVMDTVTLNLIFSHKMPSSASPTTNYHFKFSMFFKISFCLQTRELK